MKIIVSHDVDHIKWSDHTFKDLFIPKYLAKAFYYGLTGKISPTVFKRRLRAMSSKLDQVPELCAYNNEHNIPATFFVGMANALGLSYPLNTAIATVNYINAQGLDTGPHGIAYATLEGVREEFNIFKQTASTPFGIRNHYLRMTARTLSYQAEVGYSYGSTMYGIIHPFKVGNMWEFPISIMDAYAVPNPHNNYNMQLWKDNTMATIEEAIKADLPYFVINFHDTFFCDTFENVREWYFFITDFFRKNNYEFISFSNAVKELNAATL